MTAAYVKCFHVVFVSASPRGPKTSRNDRIKSSHKGIKSICRWADEKRRWKSEPKVIYLSESDRFSKNESKTSSVYDRNAGKREEQGRGRWKNIAKCAKLRFNYCPPRQGWQRLIRAKECSMMDFIVQETWQWTIPNVKVHASCIMHREGKVASIYLIGLRSSLTLVPSKTLLDLA